MDNDFFKKEETKVEPQTSEIQEESKIKLGEKEYTQDELSQLVGLGETAREYESKWNRKIDQFYPDYTQKSQKLADLERQELERQQAELRAKAEEGRLTPEEIRRIAVEEAKNLGLIHKDEFNTEVNRAVAQALAAKDLLNDIEMVIDEAVEKGQPKVSTEDLLSYMKENGIRTPQAAYKLRFESELDKWKEEQLAKIKQPGLDTQTGSLAGSKQPEAPAPITSRDALSAAVAARLRQGAGQERG